MLKIICAMILTFLSSVCGWSIAQALGSDGLDTIGIACGIMVMGAFLLHELQRIKKILNLQNEKDSDLQKYDSV